MNIFAICSYSVVTKHCETLESDVLLLSDFSDKVMPMHLFKMLVFELILHLK